MKSTLKNGLLLIVLHPLSGKIKIQDLISEFINGDKNIIGVGFESSHVRSLVSLASLSIMGFALIKNRKGQHRAINTDRPINEEYSC